MKRLNGLSSTLYSVTAWTFRKQSNVPGNKGVNEIQFRKKKKIGKIVLVDKAVEYNVTSIKNRQQAEYREN